MAVGINIPQQQQAKQSGGMLGRLATLGGMAAGASLGGAPGAALGGQLGGMAGGVIDPVKQTAPPAAPQAVGGAVERRLGQLDQSPLRQIRESIKSLEHVPDQNLRAQLAQPLFQAAQAAKRKV